MKFDITKIANIILYMIENKVVQLNDKKVATLLFLIDYNHLEAHEEKVFGEEYIKSKRGPEPKHLADIFNIIANDIDLKDDDERLYLINELVDHLDIEILEKEKFIELNFIKMEEDFDKTLFSKDEMKTIGEVINKHKDETPRQTANATFQNEKVRETALGETII